MNINRVINYLFMLLMMSCLMALLAVPSFSTAKDPPLYTRLSNEYINYDLGWGNKVTQKIGDTTHNFDVSGRFAVSLNIGDPETTSDDHKDIITRLTDDESFVTSPCWKNGIYKVKVGKDAYLIGDTAKGSWVEWPEVFTPPAGLGLGKTGSYMEAIWQTNGTNPVQILITASLIRDQARVQFDIKNVGTTSQAVGFEVGGAWGNSPKAFVPGFGPITYGRVFRGRNIPDVLEMYDNLENPGVVSRNYMGLQDSTKPDSIAIGEYDHILGTRATDTFSQSEIDIWLEPSTGKPNGSYVPDVRRVVYSTAWLQCWNQKVIAPKYARTIVVYYGVGATTSAWTVKNGAKLERDSAVLATQSPRALKYNTLDPARSSDLSPDTFTIQAYVANLATDPGPYDLQDVSVSILLPDGLELADGDTATKSIGRIGPNSEGQVASWTVNTTGEYSGDLQYFVSARDNSGSGWHQVVERTIKIPATRKTIIASGWQLSHVPLTFQNTNLFSAFDKNPGELFANYWVPSGASSGKYTPVSQLVPGKGFWLYVPALFAGSTTMADDYKIVGEENGKQSAPVFIEVKPGWNLIGNPYVYPVYWGQVQAYNKTLNLAVPLEKAIASGWISGTLFSWNTDKNSYDTLTGLDTPIEPWKGYWIRAKKAVTLIFTPASYPSSGVNVVSGG